MSASPPTSGIDGYGTSASKDIRHAGFPRVWQHVLLACGCALAITLLVTSYLQSSQGANALDDVLRQSAQVDHIDQLQMLLVDAETGVRGYLLSGDAIYLEPYERAIGGLDDAVDKLRADFADKPADQDRLDQLIALVRAKQGAMATAVAERTLIGERNDDLLGNVLMGEVREQIIALRASLLGDVANSIASSRQRFGLTRIVGIAMAVGSLLLLLVLFGVMQRQSELRERLASVLETENSRLEKLVEERTAALSRLARHLTVAREDEQARLARELHDELGSLLTAAKLDASWIKRKLPAELQEAWRDRLDRLQQTLTSGIALKRRIIDDLRPPLLKDLGLVEALRALADDFAMGNEIEVVADLPDALGEIDEERSLTIFRIAQETFTNIRKYARAKRITMALDHSPGQVRLEIADDGVGFDPDEVASDRHGIAGMLHRVQTYAGEFAIESAPGHGTRIVAVIPV
ncbi:MAG: CHASE3 domain-containing protein [Zoogloeaceae bacterium]|nr:CHASE3 domain-containing protein [Rhodocyclaceae bacterium]MCP5234661.1 CHASE3 domain-containing protein [Zoogloeaceae bacterium]